MENPREFYTSYGPMTAPGAHAADLSRIPTDLGAACEVIQGLLIHQDLASFLYGVNLSDEQRRDPHIRPPAQKLARIPAPDSPPPYPTRQTVDPFPRRCSQFSLKPAPPLR